MADDKDDVINIIIIMDVSALTIYIVFKRTRQIIGIVTKCVRM